MRLVFKNRIKVRDMEKYIIDHSSSKQEAEELKALWEAAGKRDSVEVPNLSEQWSHVEQRIQEGESTGKLRRMRFLMSIAAALIVLVGSTLAYKMMFEPTVYQSGNDKMELTLADGSIVSMNKNSELKVNASFNEANRAVELTGEAFFKVSKSNHPFVISTNVAQVKVVGTEFNVKTRDTNVELVVSEGIVDFSNVKNTSEKVRVTQGLMAKCFKNEKPNEPVPHLYNGAIGWMNGQLQFQDNTLAEICDELMQSKGIEIKIAGDSLHQKVVSGVLEDSTPDGIMEILCMLIQRNYKEESGKYVIY